jgi:hypothetical protein
MNENDRTVECATHGSSTPAYVCTHLLDGLARRDVRAIGFHEGEPDAEDEDPYEPCGWCDACEQIRAAEDGWNEASESQIKIHLVCLECFDSIRVLARGGAH